VLEKGRWWGADFERAKNKLEMYILSFSLFVSPSVFRSLSLWYKETIFRYDTNACMENEKACNLLYK
jgi:hypothetical protein